MNRKGLNFAAIFIASLSLSVVFQNCGKSSVESRDSDNGGLQVQVGDGNTGSGSGGGTSTGGGGTGTGGGTVNPGDLNNLLVFDFNRGDSVLYLEGDSQVSKINTVRLIKKGFKFLSESYLHLGSNQAAPIALPSSYCADSAFPHCQSACAEEGCSAATGQVMCHWQRPLTSADSTAAQALLNGLTFQTKQDDGSPLIADCDTSRISFFSDSVSDVTVSMASDAACVSPTNHYLIGGRPNLQSFYDAELNAVESAGALCNNFASYAWNTTKWTYRSNSGFTVANQSRFRDASYELNSQGGYGQVDLKWKDAGDATTYCANDVFLSNASEYDIFFPQAGIKYEMYRANVATADVPFAGIVYEDPMDDGKKREIFLDQVSAQAQGGGAIMDSGQAQGISAGIEMLIDRAKLYQMESACN